MDRNLFLKRLNLVAPDGWRSIIDTPLICDAILQPAANNMYIRWKGQPEYGILLVANTQYLLRRIDLSAIEVSTTSASPAGFVVIAQAPPQD